MRGLVEGDAALELLLADVAPRADVVRGDGDGEFCHYCFSFCFFWRIQDARVSEGGVCVCGY